MSINLEEKLKPRVRTPNQDISNHELSGTENQVVAGNKLKKKRKFTNFNVMYMGNSDTEGTPKRAKYEQHSETESVPQVPKRKKKGDVYIEEQTDQEIYGKRKKKKAKEKSHQEAEDTRADEKIKKSHKPKESKGGRSNEEAPDSKIAELDGRSRKKKMKQKKDHGERPLDHSLEEKLLTIDSQSADEKKKTKRKDGGEESHSQRGFTKIKHQGGFETTEDVNESEDQAEDGSVQEFLISETQHTKKKKKKRKDCGGLQEDAFSEELFSQLKRPNGSETLEQMEYEKTVKKRRSKRDHHQATDDIAVDASSPYVDFRIEASSCSELIAIEHGLSQKKKKKSKKDHGNHPMEGLIEESMTTSTADANKILEGQSVDHAEAHGKKKKKKHGGERLLGDRLTENSCSVDAQDTKKKTKRMNDGDEGRRKHSFTATTEPVAECVDEAEVHLIKKKKPKKDRREPNQETDLIADDVSSSVGLHSEEPSINEFSGTEDGVSRKKKKKSKKLNKDRLFEDSLVEESSTPCVQHTSDKRAKWKDGGHKSHRHHGFTEEFGTKKKHQSGSENKKQRDENEEMEKTIKKKKKKKKKQKDEPPQEVDDMTADEVSFAIGLRREEPSSSEFTGTKDTSRRLIKEKPNSHHWERFLENSLVEEDTEQSHGPQSSASTTRDEQQAKQNKGEKRSATLETNTKRRRSRIPEAVREQDVALLQEYLPRINNPNALKFLGCSELERVKAAKRSGIMYRSGQFTVEEDEIIRKNAQEFATRFGIESPQMLFHPYLFPEVKGTVSQLKRKYRFRTRLADGLHRFTFHVYIRGVKLFSPGTVKGRFSNEEVAQLKMYREMFGRKWQMIACALNRNYDSISMKSTQLNESNHGVWSTDETNRLIAAVKESVVDNLRKEKNGQEPVTVPKRRLYTGIPWFLVERKVETRLWTSCRIRWCNLMLMRMNNYINPFGKMLKIKAFIKVIRWLYDKNVKDYGDVKWEELSDHVGNVPTNFMQQTFHSWKKCVLGWKDMRLHAIVKSLYDDVLPGLEEKLSATEEIDMEPETKDDFLISEIFREYKEYGEKFEA